jgi:hypothetical protein
VVSNECETLERGGKCIGFWWESPKERDDLTDQGVDGKMRSEWVLRLTGEVDQVVLGYGPVVGSCKYGDEPSDSGATELVS